MIDKIISKIHSLNISHKHIITYSLCVNAFALLSLIYSDFLLFIMLFIFSIYLNKIYNEYVKKYNIKIDILKYTVTLQIMLKYYQHMPFFL